MYRTGDRGCLRPDGELEILGRLDHQVKVRGHRVELDEIGAALEAHPRVRQAVVVLRGEDARSQRLIAYYTTPSAGHRGQPDAVDLRAFLRERLPEFMVPALCVPVEHMPLNPSGKVDRRALPDPGGVSTAEAHTGALGGDAIEEKVWRIWTRLLGVRSIGVRDDFFEVGGHSMLGARLIAELNRVFEKDLPLMTLFEARTIEAQAALLREHGEARRWPTLARLRSGRGGRALFLSTRPNVSTSGAWRTTARPRTSTRSTSPTCGGRREPLCPCARGRGLRGQPRGRALSSRGGSGGRARRAGPGDGRAPREPAPAARRGGARRGARRGCPRAAPPAGAGRRHRRRDGLVFSSARAPRPSPRPRAERRLAPARAPLPASGRPQGRPLPGLARAVRKAARRRGQEGYRRAFPEAQDMPVAEHVSTRIIALPMYPELPEEAVERVAIAIRRFYGRTGFG